MLVRDEFVLYEPLYFYSCYFDKLQYVLALRRVQQTDPYSAHCNFHIEVCQYVFMPISKLLYN